MLDMYIRKEDLPKGEEVIRIVDAFFELNELYIMSRIGKDAAASIIREIDGGEYLPDGRVLTKFGDNIGLDCLGTGCKTALCVLACPNRMFDCIGCGNNALEVIIKMKNGRIYCDVLPAYPDFDTSVDIMLHWNGKRKHFTDLSNLIDTCYKLLK